jgi:hypothetical protein
MLKRVERNKKRTPRLSEAEELGVGWSQPLGEKKIVF